MEHLIKQSGFKDVIDNMPLYISKVSTELEVIWANKHAIEYDEQRLHTHCYNGFNPDLEQCTFCPVVRAISSKKTEVSLIEVSSDDNKGDRVFEITAVPSFYEGQLDGIFEIRRDVTLSISSKKPKQEIKQSKKAKDELFSSDNLLNIASIEMRNQNDFALKLHNRLTNTKLTHEQKVNLSGMKISLIKTQNILNNINVMRNINKGVIKQVKKKSNLKSIIVEKFGQYQNKTDFNGNSFDYKFDSDIPNKLIMDKRKMELIMSNLIDFSMTNTSNRYINLTTTLINDSSDSVEVEFKIRNTGSISIHDAVKKDKESYIKNNLDLSVINNLVIKQEGTFTLIPLSGYGIDIVIRIPFKKPFTSARLPFFKNFKEELKKRDDRSIALDQQTRKKILIAEDEPIGRITIEQMLKNDYEIILARNGKVAVEKYFSEQPDLVIMDIMMPIMNGFDAFDQIERNCIKRVPIIACTAKVIKSEKEYLKSYGFDDYIAKPVSMKNLRELVNRHII